MDFFAIFTIIAGVFLFGGLLATAGTGDVVYFVYGYPICAILLFLALGYRKEYNVPYSINDNDPQKETTSEDKEISGAKQPRFFDRFIRVITLLILLGLILAILYRIFF